MTSLSTANLPFLVEMAHTLTSPFTQLAKYVINNAQFQKAPASHHHHHAFPGGLLQHTAEVVGILEPYGSLHHIDRDVLITAAIWHDFHKIYEYHVFEKPKSVTTNDTEVHVQYEPNEYDIQYTQYANLIGHVVGSYTEFCTVAERVGLEDARIAATGHALLAHHGRQIWGSPVEPHTEEAFLLHMADMRSVQEFMLRNETERQTKVRPV